MALTCISFPCVSEGELQERTLSCCNAPQVKGEPRHGSLEPRLLALSRSLVVPRSGCQGGSSARCAWKEHTSATKPNKSTFYQTPQLASLPCPLLGTTWIWKLQYLLPVIELFTWANNNKKNPERSLPEAWVPSAKTWMLLNASPAAAEADSHWIFFTHTLKPLSRTLACQKMARQLTTAQLLWLSWFIHSLGHDADAQCRLPVLHPNVLTQLLNAPKLIEEESIEKIATAAKLAGYTLTAQKPSPQVIETTFY